MAVKVSIELSERQAALAEEQMRMLGYPDLSRYFGAMVEEIAAHGSKSEGRDETPDEGWLNQEAFWKGYDEKRDARTKK